MKEHYKNKRKGYVKLHIAVDVKKKKVVSVRVTDERKFPYKLCNRLMVLGQKWL
jgi:hypothetical protein